MRKEIAVRNIRCIPVWFAKSVINNHNLPLTNRLTQYPPQMSRNFFKRIMPDPHAIVNNKSLKIFGKLLHKPNLWHFNRRSIAGAFAVGLFFAWVPVPFQMVLAAASAIWFSTNLPLSVALVWVTNPLTMGPMFYFSYLVGTWVIGAPEMSFNFELSLDWLMHGLLAIWKPFLLGCLILGIICSATSYLGVNILWRYSVRKQQSAKKLRHKLQNRTHSDP